MPCRAFAIPVLALALVVNTGCQTARFYSQAIGGQWQLSSQKQPISELIQQTPATSPLREQLALVQEIVAFADRELGLPAKGAYQDYVDLNRPHVVWNVLAAPEFSLEARTWWYPVVGSLEYRGYFKKELAVEHADRLKREGEDVHVGGVTAYSTLGYFDDPVLNTFIDLPDAELAELLFHELAHRQLFLRGDTDFNEAFATAVGREGVRRWMLAKGGAPTMQRYLQRRRRDDQVIALILRQREALECLYDQSPGAGIERSADELRDRKKEIIASLRHEYEQLKNGWPGYKTFDKFMAAPINNARLNAIDTYFELVPKFERLIASTTNGRGILTPFFKLIETTRRMDKEERRAFLDASAAADSQVLLPPRRQS